MPGIVVCVDPRAAEHGAHVLEAGGNAFDAAIATAFVQMVVTPFSCGVGGMVSAHLWEKETARHFIVDGLLRAGSRVTADMWAADYRGESEGRGQSLFEDYRSEIGYSSICAPGSVAALAEVHRHLGSMPWSQLLQPAIEIARNGFLFMPVTPSSLVEDPGPFQPDAITRIQATAESARLYYREAGTVPHDGVAFRNPDYAGTLERIAHAGADDLYTGELADVIASDLESNGSFVTRDDLRRYRTSVYSPTVTPYRGHNFHSNLSPGGGPLLIRTLNVLGGLELGGMEHAGTDHLAYLASTLQLVNQDRREYLGDPDHTGPMALIELISTERVSALREAVVAGVVGDEQPPAESPDTTHLTVVDRDNNIACITHSSGQSSGVVTPGLGFVYNNGMNRFDPRPEHPSSLAPGKARVHMMMPTLVFKDRGPVMALGAPGGNAILSALVQTASNVIDFGMSAVEAVSATRIHAEGSTIWCEARVRSDVVAGLEERGFTVVQMRESIAAGLGMAQLVLFGDDGQPRGGSDPRGQSGVVYAR